MNPKADLFEDLDLTEKQLTKVKQIVNKLVGELMAQNDDKNIIKESQEMFENLKEEKHLTNNDIINITSPLVEHLSSFFLVGYDLLGNSFEYTNYPSELSRDAIGVCVERALRNKRLEETPIIIHQDVDGTDGDYYEDED